MSQIYLDQEKKNLIKKIKKIEFKIHQIVNSTLSGDHHSLFKGLGIEFDEVREYVAGDDVKSIDWNVTSRMNNLYTKRFHEERELIFTILFDISASNDFGTGEFTKKQIATEIAAALSFSVIKNRDKIGFLSFTDKVEHYLPPAKGKAQGFKIISESLFHQPTSKKTDLTASLKFISKIQPKRSVIFIISDFLFPLTYKKWIKILAQKHKIFAIELFDPLENKIKDLGLIELENKETGQSSLVDTSSKKFRKSYEKFYFNHQTELNKLFFQCKIKILKINILEDYFKNLKVFFKK